MVLLPLLGWMEEIPYSQSYERGAVESRADETSLPRLVVESQMNYTLLWILKNTTVHLR